MPQPPVSLACKLSSSCLWHGASPQFENSFPVCLWVLHQGASARVSGSGLGTAGVTQQAPVHTPNQETCGHTARAWASLGLKGKSCGLHLLAGQCTCTCRCHTRLVILFTALHQKCYWNHYKLCLQYNDFFLYLVCNYSTSKKKVYWIFLSWCMFRAWQDSILISTSMITFYYMFSLFIVTTAYLYWCKYFSTFIQESAVIIGWKKSGLPLLNRWCDFREMGSTNSSTVTKFSH